MRKPPALEPVMGTTGRRAGLGSGGVGLGWRDRVGGEGGAG